LRLVKEVTSAVVVQQQSLFPGSCIVLLHTELVFGA
jgi:hypothetical protein